MQCNIILFIFYLQGDSGGPLVQYIDNNAFLVGISSFVSRLGCDKNLPIGFTRVEAYYNWILDSMKKLIEEHNNNKN